VGVEPGGGVDQAQPQRQPVEGEGRGGIYLVMAAPDGAATSASVYQRKGSQKANDIT